MSRPPLRCEKNKAKERLARAMPSNMPRVRAVASRAETVPMYGSPILRKAEALFGDKKRDKPTPKKPKRPAMNQGSLLVERVVKE